MEDLALVATVPVAKSKATFKSGAKKGKLRKGCRYKGKRVLCTPEVASRLGSAKPKKRGAPMIVPKSPEAARNMSAFSVVMRARSDFKRAREAGNCGAMRQFAKVLSDGLQYMARLPGKVTKKNPYGDVRSRNRRYITEMDRVKAEIVRGCSTRIDPNVNAANRAQYEAWMAQQRSRNLPLPVDAEQAEVNRFNGLSGFRRASAEECLKKEVRLERNCKHGTGRDRGHYMMKVG